MNSRRAEAEVIRDSILHVAGNLDRSLGGSEIPLTEAETSRRRSFISGTRTSGRFNS
jgi:hypothetical protein